jgi:hypothetical protein
VVADDGAIEFEGRLIMDLIFLERLVTAGASLEAAAEYVETGSKRWDMIVAARRLIEGLVAMEVSDTWPDEDRG